MECHKPFVHVQTDLKKYGVVYDKDWARNPAVLYNPRAVMNSCLLQTLGHPIPYIRSTNFSADMESCFD
jgi:hypothetical protein